MTRLMEAVQKNEVLTGVLFVDAKAPSFVDLLNVVDAPLATLPEAQTRPPKAALDELMESLR
jgi:2-oxoglutarate ferredoxin oxidoreductase subunit beta